MGLSFASKKLILILFLGLLVIFVGFLEEVLLRTYGTYAHAVITEKNFTPRKSMRAKESYTIHYKFSIPEDSKEFYKASQHVPLARYENLKVGDIIDVVYWSKFPSWNDIRVPFKN